MVQSISIQHDSSSCNTLAMPKVSAAAATRLSGMGSEAMIPTPVMHVNERWMQFNGNTEYLCRRRIIILLSPYLLNTSRWTNTEASEEAPEEIVEETRESLRTWIGLIYLAWCLGHCYDESCLLHQRVDCPWSAHRNLVNSPGSAQFKPGILAWAFCSHAGLAWISLWHR